MAKMTNTRGTPSINSNRIKAQHLNANYHAILYFIAYVDKKSYPIEGSSDQET
jgi:hypothetical protein